MLTISRRGGQNVRIGDNILLRVLRAGKGTVDFEIIKDGKPTMYLNRAVDCRVWLGSKNKVHVTGVRSNTVKFGFDTVQPVVREELFLKAQAGA